MFQSFALCERAAGSAPPPDGVSACTAVIALIAQEKRVPVRLLVHRSRCRLDTARARQLAMYLSHVVLGCSLAEIGDAFGRDRTTVSHACGVIEDLRDDPAFDAEVSALEQRLEAQRDGEVDHAH
ncbi:MAG: helix-turn-helix domain-containing protein [Devosia sp.]